MPIEYLAGDLFVNRFNAEAFAHGCNCKGAMGSGIAVRFKQQYPQMYDKYREMCEAEPRQFNPGDAFLWKSTTQPYVFNLATQEHYRGKSPAKLKWIEQSLANMRRQADTEHIKSIAMPAIGAGLGGLEWNDVKAVINSQFKGWDNMLYVYEEYIQGK